MKVTFIRDAKRAIITWGETVAGRAKKRRLTVGSSAIARKNR